MSSDEPHRGGRDRPWWLDEGAHAGAEHLDGDLVAAYDAKAHFDPTDDIEILRALGLGPSTSVIDLGAGTGTFAFAAAATGASVIAVDVSPAMVAMMHRRLADRRDLSVSVVEAGFLSYDHGVEPVDYVYSRHALHQLPNAWKVVALQRLATMIRPGGVLRLRDLVYDTEPDTLGGVIEAWMASAVDDSRAGYTAAELAAHVQGEFSTFTWLLEPMLERCGFRIVERETRRSTYAAYTCRREP